MGTKVGNLPKLTIYDIKRLTESTAPYFFDRKTLKFFHQRMKDFSVIRYFSSGLYCITAPMKDHSGKQVGMTIRYFNPLANKLQTSEN